MKHIDKKVEEYRDNLIRITQIKKQMIDCEISWLAVREGLKLSQYDFQKLKSGELKEREKEILKMIELTPAYIINRDQKVKTFQKLLLEKGMTLKEFSEKNNLDTNKIYRALREMTVEKDIETERIIERALGVKVF